MECTFFPDERSGKRTFPQVTVVERKGSVSADSHRGASRSCGGTDPLRPIRKWLESQEEMLASLSQASCSQQVRLPRLDSARRTPR
jgi:hypothetical protein